MQNLFMPFAPEWFSRRRMLGLSFLLIIGAGLRIYGLSRESLWLDEACSWHTATHPTLHAVVYEDVGWHMHPPGYFVLLHYWIAAFGDSEASLRAPSVIAGIVSIGLMYVFGCRWFGPREGMLGAALISVLLYPVWYAQEARPYGMLLAFALGSMLAWISLANCVYTRTRPPLTTVALYTILAVLTCYWHYFGLMLVALQGGALGLLALRQLRSIGWIAAMYAAIVAAYVAWWPSFWEQLHNTAVGHPAPQSGLLVTVAQWMGEYFNYRSHHFIWIVVLGGGVFLSIVVAAIVDGRRVLRSDSALKRAALVRFALASGWLLIPFAFAYGQSMTSASIYTQRNMIVSAPIAYLLTAHAVALIPNRWRMYTVAAVLVGVAALVRTVWASGYYVEGFKDQYRSAVGQMLTEAAHLPGTILAGTGYNRSTYDYYLRRMDNGRTLDLWGGKDSDVEKYEREFVRRNARYMVYGVAEPGPEPAFERFLTEELRPLKLYEFRNVSVILVERPGDS